MKTFLFSPRVACLLAILTLTVIPFGGPRAAFFPNPSPITGVPLATGGAAIEANVLPGNYVLEASVDMANWVVLDTFCTTDGRVSYVDHDVNVRRFYRLGCLDDHNTLTHPLEYRGNTAVFTGGGFSPGAMIEIDSDNDGNVDLVVMADDLGFATAVIDTAALPDAQTASYTVKVNGIVQPGSPATFDLDRVGPSNPAATVPVCLSPDPDPFICLCSGPCPDDVFLRFTNSFTPSSKGVELATGKLRFPIPITGSQARGIDFHFDLNYASLVDYDGPWGQGMSHNMNLMVVRTGPLSGRIITPDLRIFDISSLNGTDWTLPDGFFSRLTYDSAKARWKLVHFDGNTIELYEGALAEPGYPVKATDPNGNTMSLSYNGSGLLTVVKTTLGQPQSFEYDARGRLQSFRNHLGHTWSFTIDPATRQLTTLRTPSTEHVAGPAGQLVTDDSLPGLLATVPRDTTLSWHGGAASNLASLTDGRGATPLQVNFDGTGRVDALTINGRVETIDYLPLFNPVLLPPLDPGNRVVRITDREGNVSDFEIHGPAGGPVGGTGVAGLRRLVEWTESGKGNPPLRAGEPDFYETRVLHDCDCLKPAVVTDSFSSAMPGLTFDANQIPTNFPRVIDTHNPFRQVLDREITDGTQSILIANTYQPNAFGDGNEFSRLSSTTDPRAFDANPIYAGLSFLHQFEFDPFGNLLEHRAPQNILGQAAPQVVEQRWTYNQFGQQTSHTDPNGNVTLYEYFAGSSAGGNVNTAGAFGGYLKEIVHGATGSADSAQNLRVQFRVNALGLITEVTDPRGLPYTRSYNDLAEVVSLLDPAVDLGGPIVQYETQFFYDAASNSVLSRRSNIDTDGTVPANAWIDRSTSYDAIGNPLTARVETDANAANDLVTRMAYDRNDQVSVIQLPEGNRTFHIYDERELPFKTFYGIAPGATVTDNYPADKRAANLGAASFVGLSSYTYDERGNQRQIVDGRGNVYDAFYDFHNRLIATSDQNGNGIAVEFDDDSNRLAIRGGAIDKATGLPLVIEAVSYLRYDENRRHYQTVQDIDLASDEAGLLDPDNGANSSFSRLFDAGGRVQQHIDGNGNLTIGTFDAVNRTIQRIDALGNVADFAYDGNSNLVEATEVELPGPGAAGGPEAYVSTFVFDELNRARESHRLGLNGTSIDHLFQYRYDSRHNIRAIVDPEGTTSVHTFDSLNRRTVRQVFDADPFAGGATELEHASARYDGNSNLVERIAIGDVNIPGATQQVIRSAFDDLDRIIRTINPDSDDPVDGSGNGPDGQFDRREVVYDENSNVVRQIDQRGVVDQRTFDPANRLQSVQLILPPGVPGETRREFRFDTLNRMTVAQNDFSEVVTEFDALSREVAEVQSIRLDGQGFVNGYQFPIRVEHGYDKVSNLVACRVQSGLQQDLAIACGRDRLNRTDSIRADYFGSGMRPIANYSFFGRMRLQSCQLGNGVVRQNGFDTKRRLAACDWSEPGGNLLAGFEYGYDRMDNALFEQVLHDGGRFDHYAYDRRYQLIGAEYRSANPIPPGAFSNNYTFDSNYSRKTASYTSPMGGPPTNDAYTKNAADEFTNIMRNGNSANVQHDRAGNPTELPVRPVAGPGPNTNDQPGFGLFDGFNQLVGFQTAFLPAAPSGFVHDAFGRRMASFQGTTPDRRYIYGMTRVLEERTFDPGATPANAPSSLERVYVDGLGVDEHVLCAIDRNGDGQLGGPHPKNVPDPIADQEYYYLLDRIGSTAALVDADQPGRVLEYVRHSTSGEPSVMPVVDGNFDGLEDTPLDLSDNAANIDRASLAYGNPYLHAGRRWDHAIGLYYNRARYYEPGTGQFLQRDPPGYVESLNLYTYGLQNPTNRVDPFGGHSVSTAWKSTTNNNLGGGMLKISGATAALNCGPCIKKLKKTDPQVLNAAWCERLGAVRGKSHMVRVRVKGKFKLRRVIKLTINAEIQTKSGPMVFNKKKMRRKKSGDSKDDPVLHLGPRDYESAEIRHAQQFAEFIAGGNPKGALTAFQQRVKNMWGRMKRYLRANTKAGCGYNSMKECNTAATAAAAGLSKIATEVIMGENPAANRGTGDGLWHDVLPTFGAGGPGYDQLPLEQDSREHMVKEHDPKKSATKRGDGATKPVPVRVK